MGLSDERGDVAIPAEVADGATRLKNAAAGSRLFAGERGS